MSHPSPEFERARALSQRGTPVPGRVSAAKLRCHQREVRAGCEFARHRWEVERHGKLVAAIIPIADLRELERVEREGAETVREYRRLQSENASLRAQLGSAWDPGAYDG